MHVRHPAEILRIDACRIPEHVRPGRQAVAEGIAFRTVFQPIDVGQVSNLPGNVFHVDSVVTLLRMPGNYGRRFGPSGRRQTQREFFS